MDNTRSFLSRFGGLILFLIAVLIIGALIYFTVQSANDDDTTDNGAETSETAQPEAGTESTAGEQQVGEQQDQSSSETDDSSATSSDTGTNEQSSQNGDVAGASNDLPNTGPETVIFSALAIGALVFAVRSYFESRSLLQHAIKNDQQ